MGIDIGDLGNGLNVQIVHLLDIDILQDDVLTLDLEHPMRNAVAPSRVGIANAAHIELMFRLKGHRALGTILINQFNDRAGGMAGAGLPFDLGLGSLKVSMFLCIGLIRSPDCARVPRPTLGVIIGVEEEAAILETGRGPEPIELHRGRRHHLLRIARADGTHAP